MLVFPHSGWFRWPSSTAFLTTNDALAWSSPSPPSVSRLSNFSFIIRINHISTTKSLIPKINGLVFAQSSCMTIKLSLICLRSLPIEICYGVYIFKYAYVVIFLTLEDVAMRHLNPRRSLTYRYSSIVCTSSSC